MWFAWQGFPDLWVPTVNCSQCSHQQLFDNYSSSTFSLLETNDTVLPCNQGEVRGPYAEDVITLALTGPVSTPGKRAAERGRGPVLALPLPCGITHSNF